MNSNQLTEFDKLQLLDVRLEDDYRQAHISGAVHNCVFEMGFTDRLSDTAPEKQLTTVIYGAGGGSMEAQMAFEKLQRSGYSDVHILNGGITAIPKDLLKIGETIPSPAQISDGTRPIDLGESRVGWTGRNLINKHHGTLAIQSGSLNFKNGKLTGGEIVLDLERIQCADLEGTDMHDILISHLHDHDFFDVQNHPRATIKITDARELPDAGAGAPNAEITADLSLRGQTHPITFTAVTGTTDEGNAAAQATLSFDRTQWGVLYGSGKFFHRLAGHLVNDFIDLEVRIITN